MTKKGKKIAELIDSKKEIAEEMGISQAAISSMLTGKMAIPLNRFIQMVYFINPPQENVNEIFDMYLEELGLPEGCLIITHKELAQTEGGNLSIAGCNRVSRIMDVIMASDLPDAAKVKVYNIIKQTK
jgi:transcriptional regulator with XRE-family HTH domain